MIPLSQPEHPHPSHRHLFLLLQRYSSYKSGLGERIEKGAASFEECEDYVRKCGEPQPQSSRHEHFENMFNYYIFPARQ